MLNSTSGGSSDTELNELMVAPKRLPSTVAVTMATPVANWPNALRNSFWSTDMAELLLMRSRAA
ncbi:hypothetical protein D3C86_1936450 [compost metagenome]